MAWADLDAMPTQCAAEYFDNRLFSALPSELGADFLSDIAGGPRDDVLLLASDGIHDMIRFCLSRDSEYADKLLDYDGVNSNVVTRVKYRRPKNRISQYFVRILNRFGVEQICTAPKCHISSPSNNLRGEFSRMHIDRAAQSCQTIGYTHVDILPTFKRYLSDMLRTRSLIPPPDRPGRVRTILLFVEKRTTGCARHKLRQHFRVVILGILPTHWYPK